MELSKFKKSFADGLEMLETKLCKIKNLLISEGEVITDEIEEVVEYWQFNFERFCAIAHNEAIRLSEIADKIYYYVVQNGFDPCNDESEKQPILTPLCEDLDKLYGVLHSISYCLGHSYNKLVNDCLDAVEVNWDIAKNSANTFTDNIITFLHEQINAAEKIINFIEEETEHE